MDNRSKQMEEIETLTAIYGEELQIEDEENRSYSIIIQDSDENYVQLYFKLPTDYPSGGPPTYQISAPHFKAAKKVYLSGLLEDLYLSHVGETIMFQWIEKIREALQSSDEIPEKVPEVPEVEESEKTVENVEQNNNCECPEIIHGEIITDRKSTFQGHAAIVDSRDQVRQVMSKLMENRKIANATHNIYAYKIYTERTNSYIHDCDDDGEAQAGSRLMHLLEIAGVKNVLVVVSRWYGGIHLGSDRFRHINNAARQVLLAANILPESK